MSLPLGDITNLPKPPTSGESSKTPTFITKIELPFNIYVSRGGPRTKLTRDQRKTLFNLFPTTISVSFTLLGLLICVRELPPFPHPVMVADCPLYLTTNEHDVSGFKNWATTPAGNGGAVLQHLNLDGLTNLTVPICNEIARFCVERRIPLHEIRLLFNPSLVCVLTRPHPAKELPGNIGGLICFWKVREVDITSLAARSCDPSPTQHDNTNYAPNLRPGVIVSSVDGTSTDPAAGMMSTLGVGIENINNRQRFVTVAAHTFPDLGPVLHPGGPNRQRVGHLASTLADTDIELVELDPGIQYINEVFEVQGKSLRLQDLAGPEFAWPQPLKMDSPFDGHANGTVLSESFTIIPEADHLEGGTEWRWLRGYWTSFSGNEGRDPKRETCGTPVVLQDTGTVAGFFRYHNYSKGVSYIVSAANITEFFGDFKLI